MPKSTKMSEMKWDGENLVTKMIQMDQNGSSKCKMSHMHQNQWSEFSKIDQSGQNGAKWGGPGHQNDPNEPKWIV